MGGIAISSWADRHRDRVAERADAVALINTTTGDLLEEINLLRVPSPLIAGRSVAARRMIRAFGGAPLFRGAQPGSRWFITMMAVGAEADPAIADFVHDLMNGDDLRGVWLDGDTGDPRGQFDETDLFRCRLADCRRVHRENSENCAIPREDRRRPA